MMTQPIVASDDPVTLVGGGAADHDDLAEAQSLAPVVVAADGGAQLCLAAGFMPRAVIGDMDSLDETSAAALPADRLFTIPEQDSTDFDKALRSIDAPLVLGVGFLGKRVDHQLATLNRLVARPDRHVIVLDSEDVICHLPPRLDLPMKDGERVSLFPMAPVTGHSTGLAWPIADLCFAPDARVGTSNRSTGPVTLDMHRPGMLLVLPRPCLTMLVAALGRAVPWPAPAG